MDLNSKKLVADTKAKKCNSWFIFYKSKKQNTDSYHGSSVPFEGNVIKSILQFFVEQRNGIK